VLPAASKCLLAGTIPARTLRERSVCEATHKGDTKNETTLGQGSPIQKSIPTIDRRRYRLVFGGTCLRTGGLPLGERGQRTATGVHQHYRAGPLIGRNRGLRPDIRLRRRRIEASTRRCSLRSWH